MSKLPLEDHHKNQIFTDKIVAYVTEYRINNFAFKCLFNVCDCKFKLHILTICTTIDGYILKPNSEHL